MFHFTVTRTRPISNSIPELPLVVAVIPRRRLLVALGLCLLRLVLLSEAQHSRLHEQPPFLQLFVSRLRSVRSVDWHCGLLGSLCICEEDLWVGVPLNPAFSTKLTCEVRSKLIEAPTQSLFNTSGMMNGVHLLLLLLATRSIAYSAFWAAY
jgi:hypothetical protein